MNNEKPIEAEVISSAVAVRPQSAISQALGVDDIIAQVNLIQNVMRKVMKEGEHYGAIPGCGDKKVLLQPGAQKLTMTFRLCPEYVIQEVNLERGHKEYRIICTLKSMGSGAFLGQGVGCCSTMESKYRYRGGSRKCPKCGKETIIKGKAEYGGGWLCFGKKGGCGAKWPDGSAEIESQSIERVEADNPADCYNCVTPETKILTHDLQWMPAGEIQSGDMLIGVDEEGNSDPFGRSMAIGEATVHGRKIDQLYEVTFEDGRIVRCNGEHKWLVKKIGLKGTEWASTQDIYKEILERQGRPRHWSVMSLCHPWAEDASREAGYIAGLLDGDGSLGTIQILVMFAQQENIVLSRMQSALEARGFSVSKDVVKGASDVEDCVSKKHVFQLRVRGGLTEQMRALGTIRPPRLLERWLTLIDLSDRRLENRYCPAAKPSRIASVTAIGEGEIVLLGTTCRTYFAEGLACHNTVLKMAKKRAFVDATITATAASDIFTQDIGDDGEPEDDKPVTSQQKPQPKKEVPPPVATDKKPAPKMPTAATRKWMIDQLKMGIDQPNRKIAQEYFEKVSQLLPTETVEDLPLRFVPWDKKELESLGQCIANFEAGGDAVTAFDPHGDADVPASKPVEVPRDSSGQADKTKSRVSDVAGIADEEMWYDVIVPVPHRGQKRDEYLKNPDTIGSLYDARHDDEEARKRLFGFVSGYEPKGWTKANGIQMPPSESDINFRDSLNQFGEWFEKNHPGEGL